MNLQLKLSNSRHNICLSFQFSIYAVNFIVILQTIAKILQIYCRGILIWAVDKYVK